jgi:Tfp pilus assembly protein PilN
VSQVNLLPPELLARHKTRRLATLVVGAGAVLMALLVGFWFLQGQKLSGINDDIAAQNATNAGLQAQIDGLQDAQALQEEAAGKQALLTKAFAGELSFSQLLMDLSKVIPSDAYLSSFDASLVAAVTTGAATTTDTTGTTAFAGSFKVEGAADGFESIASWLTRLESVRGWVNPWLSNASETGSNTGLYTFSSGADLSSDALTDRGREGATSGG